MTHITPGKSYRFAYPVEFTGIPEYNTHRNSIVSVTRKLINSKEYDREDGEPMFEIRAGPTGGTEKSAWPSTATP